MALHCVYPSPWPSPFVWHEFFRRMKGLILQLKRNSSPGKVIQQVLLSCSGKLPIERPTPLRPKTVSVSYIKFSASQMKLSGIFVRP